MCRPLRLLLFLLLLSTVTCIHSLFRGLFSLLMSGWGRVYQSTPYLSRPEAGSSGQGPARQRARHLGRPESGALKGSRICMDCRSSLCRARTWFSAARNFVDTSEKGLAAIHKCLHLRRHVWHRTPGSLTGFNLGLAAQVVDLNVRRNTARPCHYLQLGGSF